MRVSDSYMIHLSGSVRKFCHAAGAAGWFSASSRSSRLSRSSRVNFHSNGLGDLFVVSSEGEELLFDGGEVGEVVGLQCLALDDREVDLDLDVPIDVKCGGDDVCWRWLLWSG
jgi:hypothetical protein